MKATKKLIAATVSLIAAASLTVGSTFAWFSYQSNVELGSVQFSVDSGDENLMVAVVAPDQNVTPANGSFAYTLSESTIKKQINGNTEIKYKPLTIANVNGEVSSTTPIQLQTRGGVNATYADYAAFDLVFRYTPKKGNTTHMPDLILDNGSVITAKTEDALFDPNHKIYAWKNANENEISYGVPLEMDEQIKARARDAARVAFIYKEGEATKNRIWAPSEDLGALTDSDTSDQKKGFYKGNLAYDFDVHSHPDTQIDPVVTPRYLEDSRVYAEIQNPEQGVNFRYSKIASFPALSGGATYSELRITVRIWLEGNDGDCLSTVEDDVFAFLLKFRTSPVDES